MKGVTAIAIFLGLMSGNVIWSAIARSDFTIAVERSFYEGVAITACYVASRRKVNNTESRADAVTGDKS